jgi:hypothetical protein
MHVEQNNTPEYSVGLFDIYIIEALVTTTLHINANSSPICLW